MSTKITKEKILELALNSNDPLIKQTVAKLIFALKMKHSKEDFVHILDNYAYHYGTTICLPCEGANAGKGGTHDISVAWKDADYRIISMEHQLISSQAADFVAGEKDSRLYVPYDPMISMRDD